MAAATITYKTSTQPEPPGQDCKWEEECYQQGCEFARSQAIQRLKALEEHLYNQRPATWRVKGLRERSLMTRFGEVRVKRRLYRDEQGNYHFLLDEYLGWDKTQLTTPSLKEAVVELASQVPLRSVSATLDKLTAGVVAPATVHRLVTRVAQKVLEAEERAWQACFEAGQRPPGGPKVTPVLYMEADGVWVHLQREKEAYYELKSAVAYEGWERLPQKQERYQVVSKRLYCHGHEGLPFWEQASLEFEGKWDLSRVGLVVIGGDGASWIDEGLGYFPRAVRQRDGFHLARWCRWAVGWKHGQAIYQALRQGRPLEAQQLLSIAPAAGGSKAKQAHRVVAGQMEAGVDWRWQVGQVAEGARGLGTMESQQDKTLVRRMKKRGMSWTIKGAQRMAKVIQLVANGELSSWCWGRPARGPAPGKWQVERRAQSSGACQGQWLQAGMPALRGPHAGRPWVQALHSLAYPSYPLN